MRSMNRWAKVTAVAAAAALALSACGGDTKDDETTKAGTDTTTTAEEPTKGGKITAAVAYETTNFHPSTTSSALALGGNWHVVEGLYELNMNTFEPFAALAAGDPKEVSPTEYEITLREGAKFSDGTAVTSADLVKSFDRTLAEGNLYVSMLSFIDKYEALGENGIKVTLKYPFSLVKERLSLIKIVKADATDEELTAKPVGTGPWVYGTIDEQKIIFTPNANYNGPFPATAEEMEWSIIKDDTARTTAMQEGTINVMESVPADVESQLTGAGVTVDTVQGFNLPFLMFNTTKAPFDNPKVRQAFFYAIDTDKLINNAMSGKAEKVTSFLPKGHPNYNEASTVFTYDPEKAKALLAEAGVTDLSITLNSTGHPWISALSPQIKNDLEAVGIKTEIKEEASSSLYSNVADIDVRSFDVVLAPGDPSVFGQDPDLLMNWWYGDNIWTQKRTGWGTSPKFAELQTLLSEAVQASGDAQQEKWNAAFDLLSEEVPLYPLFHRQVATGYQADKLANYKPTGTTGLNFIGVSAK